MRTSSAAVFGVLALLVIAKPSRDAVGQISPQPIAPFSDSNTEYSGFSTTGQITDVNRRVAKVTIHSAAPFYAPWAPSVAICALWPTSAPLIVHVSNGVPITVDGKKAGLGELRPGQPVAIQYSIYVFPHGSNEVFCGARKIAARSAIPAKPH
jgi:hypothetical protein